MYTDTMPIKAIILDVDGTLADTKDAHRIAFNKAFAENHLSWGPLEWTESARKSYLHSLLLAGLPAH